MWIIPTITENLKNFAKDIGCDWIGAINIVPDLISIQNCCHQNVKQYTDNHSDSESVLGYYFLASDCGYQAILHSVIKNKNDMLLDITPFEDNRKINIFGKIKNQIFTNKNIYSNCLSKYGIENQTKYYVYGILDPVSKMPFYIGKGTGNRAKTHLYDIQKGNIYKKNKIESIRRNGNEPIIEYFSEDIIDEDLAYSIEEYLILKYGRKGYEEDGILTNVCLSNRPPNFKGKTYEEIYGVEKAKKQKELRTKLQKERGGYGPKKHSSETLKKIGKSVTGSKNGMYGKKHSKETIEKIIKNRTMPRGEAHQRSKKWRLTTPDGIVYEQVGNLQQLCQDLDISFATVHAAHLNNRIPNRGKLKNWKIEVIDTEKPAVII